MIGSPETMKMVNINLIYQVLIEVHSATRQELSERTKISLTTIRAVLEELYARKQIVEMQLDKSSGGRRAQRYALNPTKNLILLFYFEAGNVNYQIINLNSMILESETQKYDVANITNFIDECMVKWNICAIGIGVSGIVDQGKYYTGCELNRLEADNIGEMIQSKYNIPVVLENNLNAIAYGYAARYLKEHSSCAGDRVNLTYIHFNKSCTGAGIVADGKVLHGGGQFAGELGFMPVKPNETLDHVMSLLNGFDECIDTVSRTLAIICCVANPSLIVIGGNRFVFGSMQLEQLKSHLKQHYLSEKICPELILSNSFQEDYLLGMKELTLSHIIPMLPFSI